MYALTFIRGRILFRGSTQVRPATPRTPRVGGDRQLLSSGDSGSSYLRSGPDFGWPASAERLALVSGAQARHKAVPPMTGVAVATSALTSFTTRLVDSKITG